MLIYYPKAASSAPTTTLVIWVTTHMAADQLVHGSSLSSALTTKWPAPFDIKNDITKQGKADDFQREFKTDSPHHYVGDMGDYAPPLPTLFSLCWFDGVRLRGTAAESALFFRSFLRCASRFLANKSREVCARAAPPTPAAVPAGPATCRADGGHARARQPPVLCARTPSRPCCELHPPTSQRIV